MSNPLLEFTDLIDFASFKAEDVVPAVKARIEAARKVLAAVTAPETPASFEDVIDPLNRATMLLSRTWGAVSHMASVEDSPALRAAFNEALPLVTAFGIELSQSTLYLKYQAIRDSETFKTLPAVKQVVVNRALRDFKLEGAFLPEDKKARLKVVKTELAALAQKFSENVLDATNAFSLTLPDATRLKGIPEAYLTSFEAAATEAGVSGYRLTLAAPTYIAVMRYAEDRKLRQTFHEARAKLASDLSDEGRFDNAPVIDRILELRTEEAQLLGFENFAQLSLADKMADSPEKVTAFLRSLATASKAKGQADLDEVLAFAKTELKIENPKNYDIAFAAEKLRAAKYAYSEEDVKRYFTLDAVFSGLFQLVEFFFDIRIVASCASVWNEDVKFFEIQNVSGEKIAQFYVDLYARPTKRSGAWMDNERVRNRLFGDLQTPVAYLVTNFLKPAGGRASLLTHDEVQTLFHEFGHGLQHMLSVIDEPDASGINGVEWDAVECASQFMENFTFEPRVLKKLTSHEVTHDPIPDDLIAKLIAARHFESGMAMLRQLEFGLFDMLLHMKTRDFNARETLQAVRDEVAVIKQPTYDRFANAFSHIFAGGYAAGYYSYKWSEVMSADAFSLFEEKGVLDYQTGQKWLHTFLSQGSSRPSLELFKNFRGREPDVNALLRMSGIKD